jgi:hypothetical protein
MDSRKTEDRIDRLEAEAAELWKWILACNEPDSDIFHERSQAYREKKAEIDNLTLELLEVNDEQ